MLERISLSSGYLECYTDETIHHRFCNFHLLKMTIIFIQNTYITLSIHQ